METFSWQKFFSGVNSVVGWAKFASFWLKVMMIVLPIVTGVWFYKYSYGKGYAKGQSVMAEIKDAEFKKWIAEHPQQVFNGAANVNNNVTKKNDRFQFGIFPLRFGWCE
jgi:hypothetical protein